MAENVRLNKGSGGSLLRTLRDADGIDWPTSTMAFATTLADGANVVQVVDPSHGLPVAVVGVVEVKQSGTPWNVAGTVAVAPGSVVGLATGTKVGIEPGATVALAVGTAVALASGSEVNAKQSGPWNVELSPGAVVALAGGSEVKIAAGSSVAVSGAVDARQHNGTPWAVSLESGAVVGIAPGAVVGLATGAAVDAKQSGPWRAVPSGAAVFDGAADATPKFAVINADAAGDSTIVPAVVGKRIRVLRWGLTAMGETAVKWRSGTTDLTGPRGLMKYASAGGAYTVVGVFETAPGQPLNLNLSMAAAVGGELTYIEVGS